ncbi:MAG TPA: branched-chain amino acid ABC transporter permease [Polyangiales bacterium]|nr:branched-chain amino acid ABC transporter permease [Polyangiales bacterium]
MAPASEPVSASGSKPQAPAPTPPAAHSGGGMPPRAAEPPSLSPLIGWAIGGLTLAAAFGLLTQLYTGQVRTVATIYMFVGLASAWNLIGGFTGYACFGQVGFFGLGGYTTAVLMTHAGFSFWLALPLSAALAAAFAALVGWPLLRLKGHYFAVATLGVAEGLREVVINLPDLTGGGGGITIPTAGASAPTPWLGNDGFYTLFLLLAAGAVAITAVVARLRSGYALRAIHQDEDAAAAIGINTTLAKITAFAGSAALTSAIGSAYAFQQVTIFPERLFDVHLTVLMVVMVVLGGAGSVVGPVIGAVGIAFASEWLRQRLPQGHAFALGGLIVLAVILLPQGFSNYFKDALREKRFSLLENVRRYRL